MNLSEPFIRRPVMTTLLTATCILFGTLAYRALPVNDLPAVDYPVLQASVAYPGASPEVMANNVATPLEKQFLQIPGLTLITSSSTQGFTKFILQFDLSKSIDSAATDVQAAITQAQGSLPTDLPAPPTFSKSNPNDQPVMYIAMTSDTVTTGQLYDYATSLVQQRISILPGVSKVDQYGTKSAVRIKADPQRLANLNLTFDDLAAALKTGTAYEGAGQFDGPNRTLLLQPQGQLTNAQEYRNLVITYRNNAPVRVGNVADAVDTVQDDRISMHFWARGSHIPSAIVILAVSRQAGSNAVQVAQSVNDLFPQIRAQLPRSITLTTVYDRSLSIKASAYDVETTLVIAFILVVIVIFVFLGRAADTLIPVVALPLSLLITFMVMHILGYSLDNLSLMAMTLAIGFLVDDAIVFLENTVTRMEHGESALIASINSAKQISFTILSMTISLAAVFVPLVFMPGLVGRIFREFAVTIIVSIIASGVVSLTLTPMMCSRMLAQRGKDHRKTWMERAGSAVIDRVLIVYGRSLSWFLRFRFISLIIWVATLVGTLWLLANIPKSFLPIGDSAFTRGVLIGQEGASPKQMYAFQDQADKVLQSNPHVMASFSMTGNAAFFPSNYALLLGFLDDPRHRPPIESVCGQLIGSLHSIHDCIGVMFPVPALQLSTGATANPAGKYSYALSGIDADEVNSAAMKLFGIMHTFPGFQEPITTDLFNHTPILKIHILHDQAATYHVSDKAILDAFNQAYSQNYVYLIKQPLDQYEVILEAADPDRRISDDLKQVWVRGTNGNLVPLPAVATWDETLGSQSVNHINKFASVTISFNLLPGVPIGAATDFIQNAAKSVVPVAVHGELQGEAKDFSDTIAAMTILIVLAVFVMYVILGILYESYVHPLTVLSSLPVALVGGLLTLYLFGAEASLYAYVGMFLLMGIVKKNGIMLIDFALQRQAQGQNSVDAVHDASMNRFRPIMMTTMAALMGAVPIALGFGADGASRRPLGLVIVGGLIFSQFITLYVTPVIYLYLEEFQERVLDKTKFFHSVRHISGTDIKVMGHECGPGNGDNVPPIVPAREHTPGVTNPH